MSGKSSSCWAVGGDSGCAAPQLRGACHTRKSSIEHESYQIAYATSMHSALSSLPFGKGLAQVLTSLTGWFYRVLLADEGCPQG